MALYTNWPTLDTTRSASPLAVRRGVPRRPHLPPARAARETRRGAWTRTDVAPGPEGRLQGQESLALLSAALGRVPAARRSVVVMHDLEGVEVARHRAPAVHHEVRGLREALQGAEGAGLRRAPAAQGERAKMKRRDPELDPELAALLEFRKVERRLPAERARAGARSRAGDHRGGRRGPARAARRRSGAPACAPAGRRRGRRSLMWVAVAASIAIVAGAVGAVAALRGRAAPETPLAAPARARLPSPAVREETASASPRTNRSAADRAARGDGQAPRPARGPATQTKFTAELELLQRAQAAYTRRDFSGALALVAEHARRFPNGRLAEEREALRVRCSPERGARTKRNAPRRVRGAVSTQRSPAARRERRRTICERPSA